MIPLKKTISDSCCLKTFLKSNFIANNFINQPCNSVKKQVWSHIAHMILSMHTQAVSVSSFSLFHIMSSNQDLMDYSSNENTIQKYMAESARLYSPCAITRTVLEKETTGGFVFLPGMTQFVSPCSVHLDEKVPFFSPPTTNGF